MFALLVAPLALASPPDSPDYALITPGSFHGDEVPYASGDGWVGLYRTEDGYELRETAITVTAVEDPVIDAQGGMTGKEVKASAGDDALFLLKGPALSARKVEAIFDSSTFIYPGQTITGRSGKGWLDITAVATVGKPVERPGQEVRFSDYALHFTERVGDEVHGIAVAPDRTEWDDARPTLVFVGDLDGDGRLDAIVDPSAHYNVSNPTLMLSKPAGPAGVLSIVANLLTNGC